MGGFDDKQHAMALSDRRAAVQQRPPRWEGDLKDDCTAVWAGFMLRAERMERRRWWWAVYDLSGPSNDEVASSWDTREQNHTGHQARCAAQQAVRLRLGLEGPEARPRG